MQRDIRHSSFPGWQLGLLGLTGLAQLGAIALGSAPAKALPTQGAEALPAQGAQAAQENKAQPQERPATLESSGLQILSPQPDQVLDVPSASITVRYPLGETLELQVNGSPVPASAIGRTETDNERNQVTQTFVGVALHDGNNTLTVKAGGQTKTLTLQVRGIPKSVEIKSAQTRIPADGRSLATINGALKDEQGNRSNREALVTLVTNAGDLVGTDAALDQPGFQVKAVAGQFSVQLKSGLEAKQVTVKAIAGELQGFTELNFETDLRPAVATGVIDLRLGKRGTDYFGSLRDWLPVDRDNSTRLDVRAAAFATGRVGNWLLTGAFNSTRTLNETCDSAGRLFRDTQACEQTYPVYGDSSQSYNLAPSKDSLYLRLERTSPVANAGTDYVMWGDYSTEEFARPSQQFTATSRQLHGFKANYNLGPLQVTGFYGNNLEGFQRDSLVPDGTSGYYFVSRRLLVEGSENVFLETEELDRPGTVITREALTRGPDYEIDYDRGSILFRRPVLRTDISDVGQTLVRRIIVTYQYDTPGQNNSIYGGRMQYNFSRDSAMPSWLGATYLSEDRGARSYELYGADALLSLGPSTKLLAEYAHAKNQAEVFNRPIEGSAYRFELNTQITQGIQGRAFYRSTDAGFANNATTSFTPGQTRYGASVNASLSPQTQLRLQYDHEDNRGIAPRPLSTFDDLFNTRTSAVPGTQVDNSLTTLTAGLQQKIGKADLSVDYLHRDRTDRLRPDDLGGSSDQLRTRLQVPLAKNLTLAAENETTLSKQVDAVYSDRSGVGLTWQPFTGVNVQLAQQWFTKGPNAGKSITGFNINSDYALTPSTTLKGRYSLLGGANELTMQGAIGLNQIFQISPGLRIDASYEHVFGGLSRSAAGQRFAQPYTTGQTASALGLQGGDSFSIGFEYVDSPQFQTSARWEHRQSSSGSNTVISAAAAGKITPSLTALMRYQQASSANQLLDLGDTQNFKLGLAYRDPRSDKFNALLRYESRRNPSTTPDTILLGSGTGSRDQVFSAEAVYAPSWRWEFYGKFALRNSKTYLASDLVGSSRISLAQARATYRLGYKWDVATEARWINQPGLGFRELGWNAELGYYLTPNLRLAGGYSFGRVRDRDFDGSRSADGFYLGLTVKLNDLINGFGLQRREQPKPDGSNLSDMPNSGNAISSSTRNF